VTRPVQRVIDEQYDRIRIRERFKWEHARRSDGQRWRYLREQLLGKANGKAQGVGTGVRHV